MKPFKITLQTLFALSLLLLTTADCNGPTEPEYDGPWVKVERPPLIGNYAIHFNSPNDGWSCGFYTIGHWNGNKWEIVKELGNTTTEKYYLKGISSVSPDDMWFSGTIEEGTFPGYTYTGVIVRYLNGNWELTELDIVRGVSSLYMFPDGTGWGAGGDGIVYFDGLEWSLEKTGEFSSVHFNSKSDGWACGLSSIYHWDGTEWTFNFSDSSVWFQDIYFNAPDDGWAVAHASFSGQAEHFHYDGSGWTRITDPIIEHVPLDAVHFVDSNWGWFIGSGSTYFYDGNGWTEYESGLLTDAGYPQSLNDIYCVNKNNVWICCDGHEYFLHFSGGGR